MTDEGSVHEHGVLPPGHRDVVAPARNRLGRLERDEHALLPDRLPQVVRRFARVLISLTVDRRDAVARDHEPPPRGLVERREQFRVRDVHYANVAVLAVPQHQPQLVLRLLLCGNQAVS